MDLHARPWRQLAAVSHPVDLMLDTIIGRADNARLRSSLGAVVSKIKFEICVR